ncbi:protein SENESCENCE-ASSOCIATED GENE 21, mitochondrial-like [Pyrus x bretschneideri]|uniref:protein SENESCENCE-ASSOCIATED GENE 21, mitochondrial-like n=1 Tax=Pyrus x bretschneideri TaxID=225117 RepID=UPI0020306EBD|nr:protein SENESCENCE-ASSOCIATED GENE 21, mitochondrial-like [Pyrus x bretschneideri]
MAKVPKISSLLLRRSYKAAAESVTGQKAAATTLRTTTESGGRTVNNSAAKYDGEHKQAFWMQDPKTGNWIPETHFGEVDAAEQREKLLRNPNNKNKL